VEGDVALADEHLAASRAKLLPDLHLEIDVELASSFSSLFSLCTTS
jgi:hypothetical protein